MPASKFDQICRSLLRTKFFVKGWGGPDTLKRLFDKRHIFYDRELCQKLVGYDYRVHIDKEETHSDYKILEGHFKSPFVDVAPGVVPKESENAYFQMLIPKNWNTKLKPVCLHLAGTGDHFFWRRRTFVAKPLLRESGIASIILENPFYGLRKPKDQFRSALHNVTDIFVMGGCLTLESIVLFRWLARNGYGPFGVTGISMGGHMASIAACNWSEPIALIPCLSWSTASCVFTQGVMSGGVPWHLLQSQYLTHCMYHEELNKKVKHLRNDDAFQAGWHFAENFPASMDYVFTLGQVQMVEQNMKNTSPLETQQQQRMMGTMEPTVPLQSIPEPTEIKCSMQKCASQNSIMVNVSNSSSSDLNMQRTASEPLLVSSSVNQDSNSSSNNVTTLPKMGLLSSRPNWLPTVLNLTEVLDRKKKSKECNIEAIQFMRGIMDEFTHLSNFSRPVDPNLVCIVAAEDDAYVLREGVTDLTELWPGSEVRYINTGHISAFIFKQKVFRKAITDSFDKLTKKYYSNN